MAIPLVTVPSLLVKGIQETYEEILKKPRFIRSWFRTNITAATTVSVETQRNAALIAKDRTRNAGSQLNRGDKSTVKQFDTPFYSESFNITDLDAYTRMFGAGDVVTSAQMDNLLSDAAAHISKMQIKIERAYELQCSQVLFERKLTFEELPDVDFLPKVGSTIAASANGGVWGTNSNDIILSIIKACQFVSVEGNATTSVMNLLCDGTQIENIINNLKIQSRADIRNYSLVDIKMPIYTNTTGASYHGQLSAGAYKVNLWSYDQTYNNGSSKIPYLPINKAVVFPMDAELKFRFAGVSHKDPKTGLYLPLEGEWHTRMINDDRAQVSNLEVASSGIAIPYAVDQIAVINTNA